MTASVSASAVVPALSAEQLALLARIVKEEIARKGVSFYGWVNPPVVQEDGHITHTSGWGDSTITRDITAQEAVQIMDSKLNGAYGERFALSIAVAIAASSRGAHVALLQIQKEEGVPFDANGWLVLAINGHPIFHLAPWDLPTAEAEASGLVTLVAPGSPEAEFFKWKNTDKVGELSMLLDLMLG